MSSGEVCQHYYEVLDPSGLDSEASVSGIPDPTFCSQEIFSSLLVSNLERIRRRYELHNGFSLIVPSGDIHLR